MAGEIAGQMAGQFVQPNLFEMEGRGTRIAVSLSSFTGGPQLQYRDMRIQRTFTGPEINIQDSDIGLVVKVVLERTVDFGDTILTLFIPHINMSGTETPFRTVALLVTTRTSIGGPGLVRGPLETYQVLALRGIARAVVF
ncbi:MAG TPA: hypothetical protein VN455_05495 [Methanotrichaceae archaeon]|nr:hypothetical protein [Methanotrichaceae archaeon]